MIVPNLKHYEIIIWKNRLERLREHSSAFKEIGDNDGRTSGQRRVQQT
jgi:hypothetical protein